MKVLMKSLGIFIINLLLGLYTLCGLLLVLAVLKLGVLSPTLHWIYYGAYLYGLLTVVLVVGSYTRKQFVLMYKYVKNKLKKTEEL